MRPSKPCQTARPMSDYLSARIEHPVLLIVVAFMCSPALFYLARWFFEDLEAFLKEAGYRDEDDIWWKFIRFGRVDYFFWYKVIGFLGIYGILVGLSYHTIARLL